jgi:RHS repeat-associated protein
MPGQYYDAETGLTQNYARDYDSALGRYVESDPIGLGGGVNTYAYALGNPIAEIDPSGMAPPGRSAPSPLPPGPFEFPTPGSPSNSAWAHNAASQIEEAIQSVAKAIAEACKKDDDPCDKVLDRGLLRKAGILGQEHTVKADALGTGKSLSMFDLCGCKDGRDVVKAHGCKGPVVAETGYRWK